MSLLIHPGKMMAGRFKEKLNDEEVKKVGGFFVNGKPQEKEYRKSFPNVPVFLRSKLIGRGVEFDETTLHQDFGYVHRALLQDYRTALLFERFYGFTKKRSQFNMHCMIERGCWNSIGLIFLSNASAVVFPITPHSPTSWILGKTAEYLGLNVYFQYFRDIPNALVLAEGIDKINLVQRRDSRTNFFREAEKYYLSKRKTYDETIPEYEKVTKGKYGGKFFSFKEEVRYMFSSSPREWFRNALDVQKKRNNLQHFKKLSLTQSTRKRYIVMFLHYQPERTTLPEGGFYCQQVFAVRVLSRYANEKNMEIVVKEHPSVFRSRWQPLTRDKYFYDTIANMKNCRFARLDEDPYALIDGAVFCSTVNGTVIVESLARHRPVLVFGNVGHLCSLSGVFEITDLDDVRNAFLSVSSEGFAIDHEKNIQVINDFMSNGFEPDEKKVSSALYTELLKFHVTGTSKEALN